ncbi:colicin V production protein [Escherichia coli]|uniref:Colicin V production protein n=1 Tax=Escherichia coli TaxID=562 RepID=A0A376L9B8_ECOLX|nr:colicin V production protein [Escherichia coli]
MALNIFFSAIFIDAWEGNPYANVFFFLLECAPNRMTGRKIVGHNMVWIDYAIIAVIAFSSLVSLIRGFVS